MTGSTASLCGATRCSVGPQGTSWRIGSCSMVWILNVHWHYIICLNVARRWQHGDLVGLFGQRLLCFGYDWWRHTPPLNAFNTSYSIILFPSVWFFFSLPRRPHEHSAEHIRMLKDITVIMAMFSPIQFILHFTWRRMRTCMTTWNAYNIQPREYVWFKLLLIIMGLVHSYLKLFLGAVSENGCRCRIELDKVFCKLGQNNRNTSRGLEDAVCSYLWTGCMSERDRRARAHWSIRPFTSSMFVIGFIHLSHFSREKKK